MSEEYVKVPLPGFEDEAFDESTSHRPLMAFPRQPQSQPHPIKRFWLKNLKGFRSLEIELGKFNVLVGPNNCGKSTILQAIDLCFRLMQFHVEFQRGVLAKPRAGKRVIDEMLPVAELDDFWFMRKVRVRNERIPVTIGVELEGENDLVFEFEIRRLWGSQNSRMTRFPAGLDERVVRDILARRPTLVPSSVGVVSHEEYRVPARLELLSLTGHHNEVLRNYLRELADKKPDAYQSLQDTLEKHFGGKVGQVEFDLDSDQYISILYHEEGYEHDIFSAGGGFLQVLQLLTYLYLHTPGTVLLDEPDAHLHSSLQRLVIDLLEDLNKREKIQVILATHSKEIINYVDTSYILPISRSFRTARPLERYSSVLPILQDLGAIDNADLAALVASRRCVFVEGNTDKKLLARFAARLGSTVFEGHSQVVAILMQGVDHPEKYVGLDILESVIGKPVRALVIRDRDGLPDDLVTEVHRYVAEKERDVLVLEKTHIENYLLMPNVIWRVICDELRERGIGDAGLPTLEQIEEEIQHAMDSLYDETLDAIAVQINKHYHSYHDKHLDPSRLNQMAREFLKEKWPTLEGKLSVVPGKKALRTIRRRIQEKWKVSFTDNRIVEAMTEEEIPPEIKEIVSRLEAL